MPDGAVNISPPGWTEIFRIARSVQECASHCTSGLFQNNVTIYGVETHFSWTVMLSGKWRLSM